MLRRTVTPAMLRATPVALRVDAYHVYLKYNAGKLLDLETDGKAKSKMAHRAKVLGEQFWALPAESREELAAQGEMIPAPRGYKWRKKRHVRPPRMLTEYNWFMQERMNKMAKRNKNFAHVARLWQAEKAWKAAKEQHGTTLQCFNDWSIVPNGFTINKTETANEIILISLYCDVDSDEFPTQLSARLFNRESLSITGQSCNKCCIK